MNMEMKSHGNYEMSLIYEILQKTMQSYKKL